MATCIWDNIGSSNGLLSEGMMSLLEPMLTYHQHGAETFIWRQLCERYLIGQSYQIENRLIQISLISHKDQWIGYNINQQYPL